MDTTTTESAAVAAEQILIGHDSEAIVVTEREVAQR
jgi:hypothetical protein